MCDVLHEGRPFVGCSCDKDREIIKLKKVSLKLLLTFHDTLYCSAGITENVNFC
jgi:hypothetical protein